MLSLSRGNASPSTTGSRPTTAVGGLCRELTIATCHTRATSVELLPFPASTTKLATFVSPYIMATSTTSLVCGNASHSSTGSRPTTPTGGMFRELLEATCHETATSGELLPFPPRLMQLAISSYRLIHGCEVFYLPRGKLIIQIYYLNRKQTQVINMSVKYNVQNQQHIYSAKWQINQCFEVYCLVSNMYNVTVRMIVFRLKQAKQESKLHKLSNSVVTNIAEETAFTITVNQATNMNISSSTSNRFMQDHTSHTSISQYNNTQLSGTTIDTLC